MIFTSYNQNMAQEGLRQLELIVNNQQNPSQLKIEPYETTRQAVLKVI